MKKLFCLSILAIALTNCQKKEKLNIDAPADESHASVSSTAAARGIPTAYRVFSRVMGSYSCNYKGGNCLPTIVVTPSQFTMFKDLLDLIANEDAQSIREFFEINTEVLLNFMPQEEIDAVLSGEDTLTSVVNSDGVSNFIIFTDSDKVEMMVLPVTMP